MSIEHDSWMFLLTHPKWGTLAGTGALESGSGPGSYDIRQSVWHVNVSRIIFATGCSKLPSFKTYLTCCQSVVIRI